MILIWESRLVTPEAEQMRGVLFVREISFIFLFRIMGNFNIKRGSAMGVDPRSFVPFLVDAKRNRDLAPPPTRPGGAGPGVGAYDAT